MERRAWQAIRRCTKLNDGCGHLAGDDCLKQIAHSLMGVISRSDGDLLARYGGDEFIILLVDTDRVGARTVAERVKAGIDGLALPHQYSPISDHVTGSLGVATMVPDSKQAPTDLIVVADRMLYRAKEGGRNRVMSDET
ncbi:MAG: diguanylate cyclase [Alphaproteobacteria bacterium]|nr:diguanylate cyclase [Alphaproteobacteria bacterium]